MSDTPNSKKLDENQMDQLLSSFYKMEVPPQLGNLPSSWAELRVSGKGSAVPVATVIAAPVSRQKESSAAGRAFAVIASLAACMMLVAVSNMGENTSPQDAGTMAVSGDAPIESGIVDPDLETTLEEVDGFQFEPGDAKPGSLAEPKTETEN